MDNLRRPVLTLASLLLAVRLVATDFYVSPTGSSSGDGSTGSPWSLAKAFTHPAAVKPGDTIWLRGGTYTGRFTSQLKGEPNKPIIVRQYPGERVTFDTNDGIELPTINVRGSYTWLWGFEVTDSNMARSSVPPAPAVKRGAGVHLLSPGSKLINLVIHDTGQGVLSTDAAPDAEINGCLIYYNGLDGPDRGHGHGIYVQNDTGNKRIVDNILFRQFGWGIHAYTEGGKLNDMYFEGNTSFDNGILSKVSGPQTNFLIGASGAAAESPDSSEKVAKKTKLLNNYSFFSIPGGVAANLGYSKGIASPTILDNYLVAGRALALVNAFAPITMSGNTVYGTVTGFASADFPGNTFTTDRPTGVKVFVRPNQYEPGRANITIYNWDRQGTVAVSLKGILSAGTEYEIRNAQNFFGPVVRSGTYDGSSTVPLPMTGLTPATPVGLPTPTGTGPDFQVFVVVPKPPSSNGKRPAASFSFAPRAPAAGETVSFDDLSRGPVISRLWEFDDEASGAQNTSTAEAPAHTFSAAGTYVVQLTVSNDGGSSTRTREITVIDSPGTHTATLPVAGHVLGAGGATFVTDVALENPTAEAVTARLVFSGSGGDPPVGTSVTLGANETRLIVDAVAAQFGVGNAFGSLRVETEGSPAAPIRLAGRTYVDEAGATLGLGAAGLSANANEPGVRYLSNLAIGPDFRTNVGAVNPSDTPQTFSLQLRDGHGNIVGRATLALEPGAQQQWSLSQLFPGVTGSGFTAHIRPSGAGRAPLAYAAVTDNVSSDPTYYAALSPAPVLYVPGIAGITGFGGAFFRSEISIANGGEGPAAVTVTFLEHDRDNSSAPNARFVLGPYETLHMDDALFALFGLTETYGALRIQSDSSPGVTVFDRILTDATRTAGTVGQQVEALAEEQLVSRGSLLGVRQDDAFRTNVGLVNPHAASTTAALRLIAPPATELGTATVVVPPQGYVQRNLAALFPGVDLPEGVTLSLRVDGGGRFLLAFASVIDNASQDPTFYPEQP